MRGDDHHEAAFAVDVVKDLAPPDSGTVPHLTLRAFIFGGSNRGSTTSSGERAWGWGRRLNPTWARPAQSSRWDEDLYAGWPPRREPVRSDILLEVDNATRFTEAFHEPCEPGRPVERERHGRESSRRRTPATGLSTSRRARRRARRPRSGPRLGRPRISRRRSSAGARRGPARRGGRRSRGGHRSRPGAVRESATRPPRVAPGAQGQPSVTSGPTRGNAGNPRSVARPERLIPG